MYGILFAVLKLACYYHGVIMAFACYILIDIVAVIVLSYAITTSAPKKKLSVKMPPASLLGATTALSVVGMAVMAVCTMLIAFLLAKSSASYTPFPLQYTDQSQWWTLGDSIETTIIFAVVNSLFVTSSITFSLGGQFRKAVYKNVFLVVTASILLAFTWYLLLAESNTVTRVFHMASESFNAKSTESPAWIAHQAHKGSGAASEEPIMSFGVRLKVMVVIGIGCVLLLVWEKVIVMGPLRETLRFRKVEKLKLKLKP